jgi:hypothetical protein
MLAAALFRLFVNLNQLSTRMINNFSCCIISKKKLFRRNFPYLTLFGLNNSIATTLSSIPYVC